MPKEKQIYTITKTCYSEGDITHRHERAFEDLYDALHYIGVWSNMKTMSGYTVEIFTGRDACLEKEHCYLATKKDDNNWVIESDEIILRKITIQQKEES